MAFGIVITPADKYFSLCVRERSNWTCERCGMEFARGSRGLECAHYFGRKIWSVRLDPENAFCLCCGCHAYFHQWRTDFEEFCEGKLGSRKYNLLVRRAHDVMRGKRFHQTHGKGEIARHYQEENIGMLAKRSQGDQGRLDFRCFAP